MRNLSVKKLRKGDFSEEIDCCDGKGVAVVECRFEVDDNYSKAFWRRLCFTSTTFGNRDFTALREFDERKVMNELLEQIGSEAAVGICHIL